MQKALQNLSQDSSPGKAEIGENRAKNLGLGGVGAQLVWNLPQCQLWLKKQNIFHLDWADTSVMGSIYQIRKPLSVAYGEMTEETNLFGEETGTFAAEFS